MSRVEEIAARLRTRPPRTPRQILREQGLTLQYVRDAYWYLQTQGFSRTVALDSIRRAYGLPLEYLQRALPEKEHTRPRRGRKLTAANVRNIRKARMGPDPTPIYQLARQYRVHPNTISAILRGDLWRNKEAT